MGQALRKKLHDRRSRDTLAAGHYASIAVDDPYEAGEKITVLRQTRGDPLGRLHAHRQIDDAQYNAGRRYQRDWELAERGAKAIDPSKEAVDGGRIPEPLTDHQISARSRLIRAEAILGRRMHRLIHAVLIDGQTMEGFAHVKTETWIKFYGRMFRQGLDDLAVEYGLSGRMIGG